VQPIVAVYYITPFTREIRARILAEHAYTDRIVTFCFISPSMYNPQWDTELKYETITLFYIPIRYLHIRYIIWLDETKAINCTVQRSGETTMLKAQ